MMVGDDHLEALVQTAATGDEHAWQTLWTKIEPQLTRIIAQPRFLGRLGQATVRELMELARTFPLQQRRALELWARSESFDTIADTLGLPPPRDAERTVRAAIERLRRRYREVQ